LKKSFFHILRLGTIGLLLVLVCGSCTFLNKLMDWDKDFYVHQVKWEGETLSLLAKWYTGSPDNWKAIAKANPALDPNRIGIGNEIRIPADLLTTRNPMPKSFLAGFGMEKKARSPIPETMVGPEPAGVPVPAVTGEKPVLPEKEPLPITSTPAQLETKQIPSPNDRSTQPPDTPLPAAPSAQPKVEKKPAQPKTGIPPEKDEPPLFGPKGYSN